MNYVKSVTVCSNSHHGHVQGIAIDSRREYLYLSFTTQLIKADMQGNVVGSVTGLSGHLGCIAYNPEDNCVYGSLEYKNDGIGRGIMDRLGRSQEQITDGFYMTRFDVKKIDRLNMDAEKDRIMTAVYLKEVCDDYSAEGHRYGCSGIDGTTFAPAFASAEGKLDLYVSYGIYQDLERQDNDHQVILRYDISNWEQYAKPLNQNDMHRSGPAQPDGKYFLYTGNTNWGIQNLEYDPYTDTVLAAVYEGHKSQFPNWPMFFIDHATAPRKVRLIGLEEEGMLLSLSHGGMLKEGYSIPGSDFPLGSTGMISLGDGYYYFSEPFSNEQGFCTTVTLYRFDRDHFTFLPVN